MRRIIIIAIILAVSAGTALCATEDMKVIVLEPEHRSAEELFPAMEHIRSKEGRVTIDYRTNSLIAVDYPDNLRKMLLVMEKIDVSPEQVNIKVVIAEVKKSFLLRAGIGLGMSVMSGDHMKRIKYLLQNKDEASIRSEMSVKTVSGRPASIGVGQENILWATQIEPDTGVKTVEPVFTMRTGSFLNVLPRVNKDGTITVVLLPSVSELQDDRSVYEKVIETRVIISSGDTISIGGFEGAESRIKMGRAPFTDLSFSESAEKEEKKVLIFLTAETGEDADAF